MAHETLLDFVLRGIEDHRGNWREIEKVTGVSYWAISKLAQKQHKSPRLDKLERLARYFRRSDICPSASTCANNPLNGRRR